jgi:hypothetical protein
MWKRDWNADAMSEFRDPVRDCVSFCLVLGVLAMIGAAIAFACGWWVP